MKVLLSSFVSGNVFALGLGISGMTRPIKIIGFLDFFGNWDASLAFVMIGAICVYFVAYRRSRKMVSPVLAAKFSVPTRSDLDGRLILGGAIFGVGWGLGGFCPGPAITFLASGAATVMVFVAAMAIGMYLHTLITEMSALKRPVPGFEIGRGGRASLCHGATRSTEIVLRPRLRVPEGTDKNLALRILEKSEKARLVSALLASRFAWSLR